jgi:hypothetical protein
MDEGRDCPNIRIFDKAVITADETPFLQTLMGFCRIESTISCAQPESA